MGMKNAQESITDLVGRGSWAIMGVEGSDTEPTFSYTIGLHHKGFPEIIMVGLGRIHAHTILNDCAAMMIYQSSKFPHGTVITELANMPTVIIDIDKKQDYAFQAYNHYKHWDFEMQQLVMPDKKGLFPWDNGYSKEMEKCQTLLGKY